MPAVICDFLYFMLEKIKEIEDCSVQESKLLKICSLSERMCVQVGTSHAISGHFQVMSLNILLSGL